MSHGDSIVTPPPGFEALAETDSTPYAGLADIDRRMYGIQFHPEVVHTAAGRDILRNFVLGIAQARSRLDALDFVDSTSRAFAPASAMARSSARCRAAWIRLSRRRWSIGRSATS